METKEQKTITTTLPDSARIWIYPSSEVLTDETVEKILPACRNFAKEWVAHNQALHADAFIIKNKFLVLGVDEAVAGASGCSIDSSVKFVQNLGFEIGVDFFNRLNFDYLENGELKTAHKDDFSTLYNNGVVNDETPVFDHLVKSLGELKTAWLKPLGQSWHKNLI